MKVVIMAGGGGTRLWPVSTQEKPKQFLTLNGDKSLLRLTVDRAQRISGEGDVFITANSKYKTLLESDLPEVPVEKILYEPAKRDNAAAIALTLRRLMHLGFENEVMIMLPSDHFIEKESLFSSILHNAEKFIQAHNEYIVTLGIEPMYPETGYGYIEHTDTLLDESSIYKVRRFTEKPDKKTAESFIKKGNYYWNSGIFCWHIGTMWSLFEAHLPEIARIVTKISTYFGTDEEINAINEYYPGIPATSIDYGIMEKAPHIGMVLAQRLGWNDIGNWKSIYDISAKEKKNVLQGEGVAYNGEGNLVYGSGKKVHLIGIDNIGVIQTEDDILVINLETAGDIKHYLNTLKHK